MTLPPLPEEFELNWFSKRNAFDIAVKDFIEDGGGSGASAATTSSAGLVELATNAEAVTGADTSRAVTPAGLKAALDARIVVDPSSTSGLQDGTLIAYTT